MKSRVTILHGWGSSPRKWHKVMDVLRSKGMQVEALDLPGFNGKELDRAWGLDDYVEWVVEKLRYILNKDRGDTPPLTPPQGGEHSCLTLVGHSNGGRIGIRLVNKYPDLVDKLVLVNAAGIKDKSLMHNAKLRIFKILAKIGKVLVKIIPFPGVRELFKKALYRSAGAGDYNRADGLMKQTLVNLVEEDLEGELDKIKIPTKIIWGDRDKLTPLWMGEKMKLKVKGSKLKVFGGVGHCPYNDVPEELAEEIVEHANINANKFE